MFYINSPNQIPATSKTVQIFIWGCLSIPKAQWDLSCFYAFLVRLFYNKAIIPWGSYNYLHIHFLVSYPSFPIISQEGSCRPLTPCSPQQFRLISSVELRNQLERHTGVLCYLPLHGKPLEKWSSASIISDVKSVQLTLGEFHTDSFSLLMSLRTLAFYAKPWPKASFASCLGGTHRKINRTAIYLFFHVKIFVKVFFITS